MLTTILTDTQSSNVLNSIQDIEVNSTIVPEAYTISLTQGFSNIATSPPPTGSVQDILIQGQSPFTLGIYGMPTQPLAYNSDALLVQQALNDLPFFHPNLVKEVSKAQSGGSDVTYTVTFSADLGHVPDLFEMSGLVNATVTRVSNAQPGLMTHLMIEAVPSGLFNAYSSSEEEVKAAIEKSFGIRCPVSVQMMNATDAAATFDYEGCEHGENRLEETAFCGQCGNEGSVLFQDQSIGLDNKLVSVGF